MKNATICMIAPSPTAPISYLRKLLQSISQPSREEFQIPPLPATKFVLNHFNAAPRVFAGKSAKPRRLLLQSSSLHYS